METASMEVTVDLPTPPLPETTAMTFFTLEWGLAAASRLSALRSAQSLPQLEQLPEQELILHSPLPIFGIFSYQIIIVPESMTVNRQFCLQGTS